MSENRIYSFYEGKSVLLTGVTGLLGKVILERVMNTLSGVKKVYVLIRAAKVL